MRPRCWLTRTWSRPHSFDRWHPARPAGVLTAPEELESLEETLAILSDFAAMRRLTAADAEVADGLGESEADLAAAMERQGRRPAA